MLSSSPSFTVATLSLTNSPVVHATSLGILPSTLVSVASTPSPWPAPIPLRVGGVSSILVSTPLPSSAERPPKSKQDDGDNGECKLLGSFALFIQGSLGILALFSLVWKRYRERPQRPLKIWWFDVSKQVFGSALVHVANLLMSMLSAGQFSIAVDSSKSADLQNHNTAKRGDNGPNPCSFYLLNLAIDTTLGIPILILLLRLFTFAFSKTALATPPESIESGNYGHPPRASWWLKQSLIYFLGLLGMKTCVLFIFGVLPWIRSVGDWALKWTEGDERVQLFFVMLLFPLIMNGLQYYIIDGFIKNQKPLGHEEVPGEEEEDDDDEDGDSEGYPILQTQQHGASHFGEADESFSTTESSSLITGVSPAEDIAKETRQPAE
ncbi:MAG: hypothetical protein M1829_004594 [Trizodia sp. TS-e1964]|nr:MAG: hypothetical protein M1829_004594 [Trizodia sp. TS-e1964]